MPKSLTSAIAVIVLLVGSASWDLSTASAPSEERPDLDPVAASLCADDSPPAWFYPSIRKALRVSGLPMGWASADQLAWIACAQKTGYDPEFEQVGDRFHVFRGIWGMTIEEVQTVAGPWMINDKNSIRLSVECFVHGWERCEKLPAKNRLLQQNVAALRWIWLNHGDPVNAWRAMNRLARFNSKPLARSDVEETLEPFALCPVAGTVRFTDSLGEDRAIGGFHPHWGNDVVGKPGAPIRAPFDGLAVPHDDGWFAGKYVTVLGAEGYVRNAHLASFGKTGWVKAGDVIGYVGRSGDTAPTEPAHDHLEWHPWVMPNELRISALGYSRTMDAADPYGVLENVCRNSDPADETEEPRT